MARRSPLRSVALALAIPFFVASVVLALPRAAGAHGVRTAYIEITELAPGRALGRVDAATTGVTLAVEGACSIEPSSAVVSRTFTLRCPGRLAGRRLRVDGLGPTVGDAVVWLSLADGTSYSHLVSAGEPSWTLPDAPSSFATARRYVRLGVEHIATGVDHLLFLLALAVAMRRVRAVLLAETAFTLSHTLSFSAVTLGGISVSPLAAEACIALSLVVVAVECARGETQASARAPVGGRAVGPVGAARGAALAFVFGLVHGLGFAGGLTEIGLPTRGVPAALAGFACGVEAGQVVFLAVVLAFAWAARRIRSERAFAALASYAVGTAGAFLLIRRVVEIHGALSFAR